MRHPGQELPEGIQISIEPVIRQPIEIDVLVMGDLGAAVRPLDPLCLVAKRPLLGLPDGSLFRQIPFVIQEFEQSNVLIAPAEWKVRHQVIVVDEPVMGVAVEVAEETIADAG